MAAAKPATTKASEPEKVDAYMKQLKHPLKNVAAALRAMILGTSKEIGEEIKWNAPAFFYTGELKAFDPKEYKRHVVVFNFFKKDCIRLVFWGAGQIDNKSGFLQGDYADGRRLAQFTSMAGVKSSSKALQNTLKLQLKKLKSSKS